MINSKSLLKGIGNIKQTKKYYDNWAKRYDLTLDNWDYQAPIKSIELLKKKLKNKPKSILDLACGTGLFGEQLLKIYNKSKIYGSDISVNCLLLAKEKKIYKNLIKNNFKNLNIKLVIKNLKTHALRNNYLASISNGDILFPANDDMIFISNDWDHNIDTEFSKIDMNKPYCLWINSGKKYNYLHCDFPILNRAWYKSLGYIGSEFFNFWYLDTWICDLSFKSKKFLVSNKITVEQLSADTHENEVDNTFLKNKKDGIPEKDFLIWNDTENNRKIDANKLK